MKIQEIEVTNIIRQARQARHQPNWVEVFNHYGWELLGQGREGYVGLNPHKNYVIKIWPSWSNYTEFVKFAKQHGTNPHFPRFFRKPGYIPATDRLYIAMEKLEPIAQGELLGSYFSQMLYYTLHLLKRKEWSEQSSEILEYLQKVWPGVHLLNLVPGFHYYNPQLAKEVWKKLGEPPESWKQAVHLLDSWIAAKNLQYDLFDFNFMQRGTTLVFVDPVA